MVQCGKEGVRYQAAIGSPIVSTKIYTRAFLSAEEADRDAILLNSTYDTSERSDWEKWVACDSFSKIEKLHPARGNILLQLFQIHLFSRSLIIVAVGDICDS